MNPLNSILVEGNLTRDPNTRTLPSGNQVCEFAVATNRYYRNGEEELEKEVSYFDVEAWSRLGTTCAQNLKKGRGVRVVGRLKQERWMDPEGRQKAKVKIVAEHVEFRSVKPETKEEASPSPPMVEADEEVSPAIPF